MVALTLQGIVCQKALLGSARLRARLVEGVRLVGGPLQRLEQREVQALVRRPYWAAPSGLHTL